MNSKEKLQAKAEELKAKIHLFLTQGGGAERYDSIIAKFQNELSKVEQQLAFLEETPVEEAKEIIQVDSTTQKLWSKVESGINHMEMLKSNDMEVGSTFTQLKKDYKAMLEREKMANKVYGDLGKLRPKKVTEFMKKFEAIDKQIQADALANKKASTKLSDTEKEAYETVGLDVAVGLGIQFGSEEQ